MRGNRDSESDDEVDGGLEGSTVDASSHALRRHADDTLRALIFAEGTYVSAVLPGMGSVRIGRAEEADVRVSHPSISRLHAVLHISSSPRGTALRLEDLGSSNGTAVRGRKLQPNERIEISAGEVIDLGLTTMVVQRSVSPIAAAAPSPAGPQVLLTGTGVMEPVLRLIDRVAPSEIGVLLLGETGVGKDVFATLIHDRSRRSHQTMLRLNCAALTETLLESELFGHEKGAFTGANAAKPGLLESAEGGTILLDEIGELPLATQAKLLRVVEERQVFRVGALKPRPIDVRFVAATNRDLEVEVEAGRFRRDLYFRLNGITILIPPLRERKEEIERLLARFAEEAARKNGLFAGPWTLTTAARERLLRHEWPGNVRELKNLTERAVVLAGVPPIDVEHLPATLPGRNDAPPAPSALPRAPAPMASSEDELPDLPDEARRIIEALDNAGGNQSRAAQLLGISRGTLLSRLDQYGIARPRKGQPDAKRPVSRKPRP